MSRYWPKYVPVATRRAKAQKQVKKLQKMGITMQPVDVQGRSIAKSFWGKIWCEHLESFSDFENRLPRGRTYVRNGSVCHLEIKKGQIVAIVSGSSLYDVTIDIDPLEKSLWNEIKNKCGGQIGSMLELLNGKLSDNVMSIVTDRKKGLLPQPGEMEFDCSCPDWADMCKHVAAVLYGVGSRLDDCPELLFTLRGVDAGELIGTGIQLPASGSELTGKTISQDRISDIFGIDFSDNTDNAPQYAAPVETNETQGKKPVKKYTKKAKTADKVVKSHKPAKASGVQEMPLTGQSLRRLRFRHKLTVAEFAGQMGVSSATVYQWEKKPDRLNLKPRHKEKIAELFGV